MRFETTRVLVGSVPTRLDLTAVRDVWLRPSPGCESDIFVSSQPATGVAGFPIPPDGMRFDVTKEGHRIVLYVAAANDYDDNLLSILVR